MESSTIRKWDLPPLPGGWNLGGSVKPAVATQPLTGGGKIKRSRRKSKRRKSGRR